MKFLQKRCEFFPFNTFRGSILLEWYCLCKYPDIKLYGHHEMVAEDSILPATAVQKKASSRPVVRLLGWMGLHEKIQTSLILTKIISILQKLFLKSHGRFNRTLKFFITIYDRIGLIWSPLLACWYHPIHFLSGFDLTCNQNVIWTGKKGGLSIHLILSRSERIFCAFWAHKQAPSNDGSGKCHMPSNGLEKGLFYYLACLPHRNNHVF